MKTINKKTLYSCEVWSVSTNLKSLKCWSLLLPLTQQHTGLSTKIKRFTLLRSPLGNKKAKDQFERVEYRSYICIKSRNPSKILGLLNILGQSSGVRSKVLVKYTN
uniref:ribosomal protein S10 n=1 Tax=Hapterophycus canaliculatus TaxID=2567908 RepID=UPI002E77BC0E|nr:ribosomal protein S10 [Hapterophycus canaliculatus]WBP70180.1 ribosomal protein S10 [Hapterophycus canaliculatus]